MHLSSAIHSMATSLQQTSQQVTQCTHSAETMFRVKAEYPILTAVVMHLAANGRFRSDVLKQL